MNKKQSLVTVAVFVTSILCFWLGAELKSLPVLVGALVVLTGWALYHPKQDHQPIKE